MRGRVFMHNGPVEKLPDVQAVTDTPNGIIVDIGTGTITYDKAKVAYFQVVWHDGEE